MDRLTAALAVLVQGAGTLWEYAVSFGKVPGPDASSPWDIAFAKRFLSGEAQQQVVKFLNEQEHLLKHTANLLANEKKHPRTENPGTLVSILAGHHSGQQPQAYVPLHPQSLKPEALFPSTTPLDSRQLQAGYRTLWEGFAADCSQLVELGADVTSCIEQLQGLLQHYAWCIPYQLNSPDVSLYDHYRVRAALAACLTGPNPTLPSESQDNQDTPVASLIEGDISGVQRFIYTITSRGAARGLRGRSFYLQLLTEGVARYILRQLGLPASNLIYVGGGHFYLLGPAFAEESLENIREELDRILLGYHDGALYLAVGQTQLTTTDFLAKRFGDKWAEVSRSTGEAKRRRFANLPASVLSEAVFSARGHGGNEDLECQVCHAERSDVQIDQPDDSDDSVRKCELCASLEELGRLLGQSDHLLIAEIAPKAPRHHDWGGLLTQLGMAVGFKRGRVWVRQPVGPVIRGSLLGMSEMPSQELIRQVGLDLHCPLAGWFRPTVNVTPRIGQHQASTFSDMQEVAEGLKRLGVLRMDVDDLGQLFVSRLRAGGQSQEGTLSHAAALSSSLSLFFEGWVGELCRRQENHPRPNSAGDGVEPIYSIYSGGDDLFIVGAWDILPGLAHRIALDLNRYSSGQVHASAGITLHGGKYPLYQAAQEAHSALDSAKDVPGKNAVSFMGECVSWSRWDEVASLKERLLSLIEQDHVGRGLLHTLLRLYAEYQSQKKVIHQRGDGFTRTGRSQVIWGPWMWRGTYLLSRYESRAPEQARAELKAFRDELAHDNFTAIEFVGLAARWVEALTKPEKQTED